MYSSLNPGNNDKASLELSTSRNTINARYSARPWYSVAASYTAATEGEKCYSYWEPGKHSPIIS